MPSEAYPSAADDEAVVVKVAAGSGGNKSCSKSMLVGPWLAYLDPNNFEFIQRPDQHFDQAVTGMFVSTFDAETDSVVVCIFCKGIQDKVSYVKEKVDQQTGEPTGKYIPANEWYKWSQPSQGRHDPSRLEWLLSKRKETDAVQHDLDGVSAKRVSNELRTNQDFRKAVDWNPRLVADVFLFYGCGPCGMNPLRRMYFYRTCDFSGTVNVDLTKPGFHDSKKCDGRTPGCTNEWSWAEGESNSRRLSS